MSDTRIRLGPALGTAALLLATALGPVAQADPNRPVHLIWMGGNDCPPCVSWRAQELPRLQQSPAFQAVRFSYVVKGIRSPIPSRAFLPPEVAPRHRKHAFVFARFGRRQACRDCGCRACLGL